MSIKNKQILITAGPTWVPIDVVRVISNIATAETGILLAERLQARGAKVTLLLGPLTVCCLSKNIRLVQFKFFAELKDKITQELKSKKYDIVIHTAAVADYQPQRRYGKKIKSGTKRWQLNLVPTVKIIDLIKRIDPSLFLVGFKFEPSAIKETIIKGAVQLIRRAKLDLAVANTMRGNRYRAYILNSRWAYGPLLSKKEMVKKLIGLLGEQS